MRRVLAIGLVLVMLFTSGGLMVSAGSTAGMVFSDSDTRLLSWSELISKSVDTLGYAKNEIYAREGYKFMTKKYADYYGKYSWYVIDPSYSDSKLSTIQRANIFYIIAAINSLNGKLTYVPSGKKLDFDRDGKLETLTYSSPNNYSMKLKLKDGSKYRNWNIVCDTPSKKVYLGDLNIKDYRLELFVDEFGPSDDYQIYVASVSPTVFIKRGVVPGTLADVKLLKNGSISTMKRMNILMTWYCRVKYSLSPAGKMRFVHQSWYNMGNFKLKTKMRFALLKTSNIHYLINKFVIPAGGTFYLQKTDDKKWILIKYKNKLGWLLMADLYTLLDPFMPASDIFTGLIIAD